MRNTKYQIKTPQGVTSIPKKNDFINQCQTYFNQSINSKKPVNISFSFDSGNEWYDIIHFKELRMTIQNEKTQVVSRESNETSKSATNSFSLVKVLVWSIAIYGLMMIVDKNFTNIPIYDKINYQVKEFFSADKNLNNSLEDKNPTESTHSSHKEEESDIINENICSNCKGEGFTLGCTSWGCDNGYSHCQSCGGKSFDTYGRTCISCYGKGIVYCQQCNGNYQNLKEVCLTCYGKKYTKKIQCTECKGRVLKEGDNGYSEGLSGTHCIRCVGSGIIEEGLDGAREEWLNNGMKKALDGIFLGGS